VHHGRLAAARSGPISFSIDAKWRACSLARAVPLAWQPMWQKALQDPNLHRLQAEIAPFVDGSKTYDKIWR